MIPLMPSPGNPNTVSTSHAINLSTRSSDAILPMVFPSATAPLAPYPTVSRSTHCWVQDRFRSVVASRASRVRHAMRPTPLGRLPSRAGRGPYEPRRSVMDHDEFIGQVHTGRMPREGCTS